MNKEILEKIKKDYTDMDKISRGDFSEITELEKNPIIQRYKYLLDLKESFSNVDSYYRQSHIFAELIDKYSNGLIEQTNKVWFWFLDMSVGKYEKMFNASLDETDKNSIISVYLDLENSKRVITIPIDEQNAFETSNSVIRGKRPILDPSDRYYNARYEFFNLCISKGQDLAIQTMMEEERSWAKEIEESKKQELAELNDYLKCDILNKDEYIKKMQMILSKK